MTTTNHAITGALIATVVKQPALAIPLAFMSHFVCDALPHFDVKLTFGNKGMFQYLAADGSFALLAAAFLVWQGVSDPVYLAICGFAAMSPDLMWLYYGLRYGTHADKSTHNWLAKFHSKIQWSATHMGIIPEIIYAGILLTVILKLQ